MAFPASRRQQLPFWLLTLGVLFGLTLPILIQDGMFMDAVLYSSVSHNLSLGIGTFWFPQFSYHNIMGLTSFHEHPPLVFGIQSIFFRIFGNSLYVERFYTFLTLIISALLIMKLWKEIFPAENNLRNLGWIPVLLWITIPVCFWSYSNNMQENTMGVFTLFSVLLSYKAMKEPGTRYSLFILSGLFIFLAIFSKGVPGLFPVAIPILFLLILKRGGVMKSLTGTTILVLVPAILVALLFLFPDSRESLSVYLFKRALHRINEVPTVDTRFYILGRLVSELLPQIILTAIVFLFPLMRNKKISAPEYPAEVIFFMAVGLSASLPLMLTLVQKGFYFVPALPFFAIGLSLLIAPRVSQWVNRVGTTTLTFKTLIITGIILLVSVAGITVMQAGKLKRDRELLHDVYLIGRVVPARSIVTIPKEMWQEWNLQCYLVRYFNISLDPVMSNRYAIIDRETIKNPLPGYKKTNLGTIQFDLYIRQ